MDAWDDEFLCNECETPHDSIEGADECCSCPQCAKFKTGIQRIQDVLDDHYWGDVTDRDRVQDEVDKLEKEL
jgi:hypothetical protein